MEREGGGGMVWGAGGVGESGEDGVRCAWRGGWGWGRGERSESRAAARRWVACVRVHGPCAGGQPEVDCLEGDEAGQRRGEGRGPGRPDVVKAVRITFKKPIFYQVIFRQNRILSSKGAGVRRSAPTAGGKEPCAASIYISKLT